MLATTSPEDAVRRATHGLSLADLARGRLRLDRPSRNGGGSTFFPGASPLPREARKSPRRHPPLCSGPQAGAASIASGLQIAIEAAMVAGLETAQEKSHGQHRFLQEVRQRVPGRDRHAQRPDQGRAHRPRGRTARATTPPATGCSSAVQRSGPPGRSAPTKAATTSRSSSMIRASTSRSSPTCSTTRMARASP